MPSRPTGRPAASVGSESGRRRPGQALFEFDRNLDADRVAGADEAGRGCLAGPLVAAAVLFDHSQLTHAQLESLLDLNDSKRVRPELREQLFGTIHEAAVAVEVAVRPASVIDAEGLHVTNLEALSASLAAVCGAGLSERWDVAVDGLPERTIVLSDGFSVPVGAGSSTKLVKGDTLSAAVAAASIVAKVTRDRFMTAAAAKWPEYGFDVHMGYATASHRDAIIEHGPTPIHRMSFKSDAYNAASSTSSD